MNNEPIAWMYERPNGSAKLTFVREPMAGTVVTETPLYTHPVKDKPHPKCDEACMYLCQMRELTDKEILELTKDSIIFEYREFDDDMVRFARAILRKASEK